MNEWKEVGNSDWVSGYIGWGLWWWWILTRLVAQYGSWARWSQRSDSEDSDEERYDDAYIAIPKLEQKKVVLLHFEQPWSGFSSSRSRCSMS